MCAPGTLTKGRMPWKSVWVCGHWCTGRKRSFSLIDLEALAIEKGLPPTASTTDPRILYNKRPAAKFVNSY